MEMELIQSPGLREKFYQYFPAGHTNIKSIPEQMRIVVAGAKGTKIWDVDGTEYLDFSGAQGPNILGHNHPEYVEALTGHLKASALCVGGLFGFAENDVVLAEKLTTHIPCAERVKLATSGTEAVQVALRIARSYTGRRYVLQFQDHYHGWIDNVYGHDMAGEGEGRPHVVPQKYATLGRGPSAGNDTLMIEWNNIEMLKETLASCGDQIALIIMEAYASNAGGRYPRSGYLQEVRDLCDQYGILLCFDEVMTGFRVGLNSAQGLFGVTPDLTTLGKAVGGGMPISTVVGKAKFMDVLKEGKTICPGTYMGHFLSVCGARTAISILERDNGAAYDQIARVQKRLMGGLGDLAQQRSIPLRLQGHTGVFSLLFGVHPDHIQYSRTDAKDKDGGMTFKFWQLMRDQNVSFAPDRCFLNIMHTDADVDRALTAASIAMAKL